MNRFRQNRPLPDEPAVRSRDCDPGHGVKPEEIFEVWSNLIDLSDYDQAAIVALGEQATHRMRDLLDRLVDLQDPESQFIVELRSDKKQQLYWLVKKGDLSGEIGAQVLGRCLNLFGILVLPLKWGTDPNPLARLAKLDAVRRRDVTIFQSLLKYVLDQTGEAIDEQRIV